MSGPGAVNMKNTARNDFEYRVTGRSVCVPSGMVRPRPTQIADFFLDDKNLQRGRVAEYVHAEYGRMHDLGHAICFPETPVFIRDPAFLLDERAREVHGELGDEPIAIDDLRSRGVVCSIDNPLASKAA